jgi:hypothetical protein
MVEVRNPQNSPTPTPSANRRKHGERSETYSRRTTHDYPKPDLPEFGQGHRILQDRFWGHRSRTPHGPRRKSDPRGIEDRGLPDFPERTDPFGQQWGIATHKEDVSREELARRQEAFFAKAAAGGS